MRKVISTILSVSILAAALPCAASFGDMPQNSMFVPQIELLSELKIMQGVGGDSFAPDSSLTRAQLSAIAVKASDTPLSASYSCVFNDVPDWHWGVSYINTAAEKGYIIGYPNGSFVPEKSLTFAEVTAVILRLMGYTSAELGRYPNGYLEKASQIGIISGLSFSPNEIIDRKTTAYILANALLTDKNNSGDKLISDLGYTLSDEVTVLSGYSAAKNEIATTGGTYRTTMQNVSAYTAMRGKLVQNSDKTVTAFVPSVQNVKTATVVGISGNRVEYTSTGGTVENINIPSDSMVYYHDEQNTFSSVKTLIASGDILSFAQTEEGFDYAVITVGSGYDGFVVYDTIYNCGISGDIDGSTVIRNSATASLSDIKKYDVVYRGQGNMIYAYSNKVSGIYESASPSKANPVSVTVSGNEYTIETENAKKVFGDKENALNTGDNVTLFLGRSGEIAGAAKTADVGRCVGVKSVLGNDIMCFENGSDVTVHMENNQSVILDGKTTTFSAVKGELGGEYQLTLFYNENGSLDYGVFEEYEPIGPVIASSDGDNAFGTLPVSTVVRADKLVSISDIKKNDVLYYSEALNTIYAYNNAVSGTFEAAYPDKSAPNKITLSGKTYEVETVSAQSTLATQEINSVITVLFGRSGKIAGVLTSSDFAAANNYGVILSFSEKIVDGTKEYYAKTLTSSGSELEIKTAKNYDYYRGKPCKFTYSGGAATINTAYASISGVVNQAARTIGSYKVSDNCKIIDISYAPQTKDITDAQADYVTFGRITKEELGSDDVLYYTINSNREITYLVLNNVTHSAYKFGIATASSSNNEYTYKLDLDGREKEYRIDKNVIIAKGAPIMMLSVNGKALDISSLNLIKSSVNVSDFDEKQITLDDTTYILEDNAVYYRFENDRYIMTSVKDLKNMKITSASVYSDHLKSTYTMSRVVVVKIKS